MRKRFTVVTLEEIAFNACFREILSNLLLCPEHRPEDKRILNSYSSLISLNPFLNSKNVRNFIRNRLDHYLVGTMNDDIRKKFVSEFNKNFYDTDTKPDIDVFLDCVLDASFTELESHVAFPRSEPNEKFIQIIGARSPRIETLKLNFELVSKRTSLEKLKPIAQSFSALANLSKLSLCYLKKQHKCLLRFLGNSCPRLKQLCITGFTLTRKEILSLVLGEAIDKFGDYSPLLEDEECEIHHIQMPSEYITSMCSTLQHLQLEDLNEKNKLKKIREYSGLTPTVVAFAIRHLPNLERIDYSASSVSAAVKLLDHNPDAISAKKLEEFLEEDASLPISLSSHCNVPFTGFLSLTSLDFVNIRNLGMMKAIGRLCPKLKEVSFLELLHSDSITLDELGAVITFDWPKITQVTFIKVPLTHRRTILRGIGSQLTHLTFASCENIDMFDLTFCEDLEVLRIFFSSTLLAPAENSDVILKETFLPKLTHLESDICLGENFSPIFEEKESLTHLDLECCHVSLKGSRYDWTTIAKRWQRLQTLCVRRCSNITVLMIAPLVRQLPKLKELGLPSTMLNAKEERESSYDLLDYFKKGRMKIRLHFERTQSSFDCPCQLQCCPYETSEEDMSSESDNSSQFNRRQNGRAFEVFDLDNDWMEEVENDSSDDFFDEYDDDDDDDDADDDYDNWGEGGEEESSLGENDW